MMIHVEWEGFGNRRGRPLEFVPRVARRSRAALVCRNLASSSFGQEIAHGKRWREVHFLMTTATSVLASRLLVWAVLGVTLSIA